MPTSIPDGLIALALEMRAVDERLRETLAARGLLPSPSRWSLGAANPEGHAAARAYPIQGILKYHGMPDWHWRTAYLPSISVNNDAAYTLTRVAFSPDLVDDEVLIGGQVAEGRERQRVVRLLDEVRRLGAFSAHAQVASRNVVRASQTGKGLGTSASASAALALAAVSAAFSPAAAADQQVVSCLARLLAGSGCRSVVGGIGLWLSYPGIAHEDCFAVRLDLHHELDDLRLVTIPLPSRLGLKTEQAHVDAPRSPLFADWLRQREGETNECIAAVLRGDWHTIGQLAELDSIRLHAVTMTGDREQKLFAWEPENMTLFRTCNDLRAEGVPVYFSTDTGPTMVLLTHRRDVPAVVARVANTGLRLETVVGQLGGPAELLASDLAAQELGSSAPSCP